MMFQKAEGCLWDAKKSHEIRRRIAEFTNFDQFNHALNQALNTIEANDYVKKQSIMKKTSE